MPLDTARTTADSIADHLADHNALHAFYNGFADFPTQYVHPDGSDSNSGNNPGVPKATIEAADGDLKVKFGDGTVTVIAADT